MPQLFGNITEDSFIRQLHEYPHCVGNGNCGENISTVWWNKLLSGTGFHFQEGILAASASGAHINPVNFGAKTQLVGTSMITTPTNSTVTEGIQLPVIIPPGFTKYALVTSEILATQAVGLTGTMTFYAGGIQYKLQSLIPASTSPNSMDTDGKHNLIGTTQNLFMSISGTQFGLVPAPYAIGKGFHRYVCVGSLVPGMMSTRHVAAVMLINETYKVKFGLYWFHPAQSFEDPEYSITYDKGQTGCLDFYLYLFR